MRWSKSGSFIRSYHAPEGHAWAAYEFGPIGPTRMDAAGLRGRGDGGAMYNGAPRYSDYQSSWVGVPSRRKRRP